MKVLVIIPAFNEELNIVNTVEKIKNISNKIDENLNYVVINDGSTDKTKNICETNKYNVIN